MNNAPPTGEEKGPYRLLRMIGSGGMGVVYEAWDTRLERRVALKLLHPHLLSDPARQRGFEREARIAARVEHPNVVRVYRIDQLDGQSAIEMQYIDGQPLSAILRSGPLTVGQAVDVLEQVLEALACCHGQGLVHCDLKPGNLLVTPDGRVYLTDFGIARALSMPEDAGTLPDPVSGPLWGTPQYSPPEAWEGDTPTPQWDLYSAGVLFHEILTGVPLFQDPAPANLMQQILAGAPARLTEKLPNLSPGLSNLAVALVARDPAQRPASARVALERLGAYPKGLDATLQLAIQREASLAHPLGTLPITPLSPSTFLAPFRGRWRMAAAIGCALLGSAALGLAFLFWPPPLFGVPSRGAAGQDHLTVVNHVAYFSADDGVHGRELWRYGPALGAPELVADIVPGAGSSNPRRLIGCAAGDLFFAATTPETGEELWYWSASAPKNQAVRMVKDIASGAASSEPEPVAEHENLVFFYATTLQAGRELWYTNSAEAQTAMVANLGPGTLNSCPTGPRMAFDAQGFYFIAFADAARGTVLFRYDYASGALRKITNVPEDTIAMVVFKGQLFFAQTDAVYGSELWVHDPAANTTQVLCDLWPGPTSSSPGQFFVWKDRLFFQARTEKCGRELWVSDGTSLGTELLSDLNPGKAESDPYGFIDGGEQFFFRAKDAAHGQEPWVSDGAPEGTRMLADVHPGPEGSDPYNLSPHAGRLFFSADDGATERNCGWPNARNRAGGPRSWRT